LTNAFVSHPVKICGLREYSHFEGAATAGADFLGMVFVPGVRRQIEIEKAKEVLTRFNKDFRTLAGFNQKKPSFVGLFYNQPASEVNRIAQFVGLDRVQLCGDEGVEYWKYIEFSILKVLHVPNLDKNDPLIRQTTLEELGSSLYEMEQNGVLAILDRFSEHQPGGTGNRFDWTLAKELSLKHYRFLLAGGLTPSNLKEAIQTADPFGVDVSSGIETNQTKDPEKIQKFVNIAREVFSDV
jgi:phosphoribosylanthranilate isomerase